MNSINMSFVVTAKCYEFASMKELKDIEKYRDASVEKIDLELNKFSASNFLYRFAPNVFDIEDKYRVLLNFGYNHDLSGIIIKDLKKNSGNIYLVINFTEILQQINEYYIRIRTLEKMSALLELDFEDARKEDPEGFIDEFDLEQINNSEESCEEETIDDDNSDYI